jgi:hypothetical protein
MPASHESGSATFEVNKDDDETSKSKKKKTGGQAARLVTLGSETVKKSPETLLPRADTPKPKWAEQFIKKLNTDEETKSGNAEVSPFGIVRPEVMHEHGAKKSEESSTVTAAGESPAIKTNEKQAEAAKTTGETDQNLETVQKPLEVEQKLSPEEESEKTDRARDLVEMKLDETEKMLEIPLDRADTPEAAAAASQFAFYRTVDAMVEKGTVELADIPDSAARVVERQLESAAAFEESAETAGERAEVNEKSTPAESAPEGEPYEVLEGPFDDDHFGQEPVEEAHDPFEGFGSNSGGGNRPPAPPEGGDSHYYGSGGPHDPRGPGGPYGPFGPAASPNFAPMAATGAVAAEALHGVGKDQYDKARAAAGGFLLGGVIGYFLGRRGGRRQGFRKAEKQAAPVKRSMERQMQHLQVSLTAKEKQIKNFAQEKFQAIQGKKNREQFVNRVLHTPAETMIPTAANSRLAAAEMQTSPKQVRPELKTVATPQVIKGAEFLQVDRRHESNLGRMLGEVPLAAAVAVGPAVAIREAAPPVVQRAKAEQRARDVRDNEKAREEIIPFNKNVKDFSRQELMLAAAKVKVEGTTLKEMAELGRLDEPGLRRVVGEFLKGGDVEKAVIKETKEKELQYEQDPRLRHHQDGKGMSPPQAVGAGGMILGGLLSAAGSGQSQDPSAADGMKLGRETRPQLGPEQIQAIRNKQVASITATVLVVIALIAIALIATR